MSPVIVKGVSPANRHIIAIVLQCKYNPQQFIFKSYAPSGNGGEQPYVML
jgi:hypothetical protein